MHEGAQREPQTVEHGEVVGEARTSGRVLAWTGGRVLVLTGTIGRVLDDPLRRTESADNEERYTDCHVGQHDTQPDVVVERVHEGEDARLLFLRLLDHDADTEVHERFAEVDHSFSR